MKPYYGCEHQVLEYNSCCHNQRKFFYADDLIILIESRMEEILDSHNGLPLDVQDGMVYSELQRLEKKLYLDDLK
mgnify:CR=1 FL=1